MLPTALRPLLTLPLAGLALGQCEEQLLVSAQSDLLDYYGRDVAVDGDHAAVGAPWDEVAGFKAGSVSTFRYDHGLESWVETQRLIGSAVDSIDQFGEVLAMADGWLFAGVPFGDGAVVGSGVVYAYRFDHGTQTWVETQLVSAFDGYFHHRFGWDVATDGQRLAVGSIDGVYVYALDVPSGQWLFEDKLVPPCPNCSFGRALDLEGDVVLLGNPYTQHDSAYTRGQAFVFERDAGTGRWGDAQLLLSPDGWWAWGFGMGAAVWGDHLVVTAWDTEHPHAQGGAAYLFARDDAGHWGPMQSILTPHDWATSRYGIAVDLRHDALLVGADLEAAAFLYDWNGASGRYELERKLEGFVGQHPYYGYAVALSERWALVGDFHGDGLSNDTGAAWIYDRQSCAPIGTNFCDPAAANSTGLPGRIDAAGVALAGGEPLLLVGDDLPVGRPALLLASQTQGQVVPPGSQGTLCLAGQIARVLPVTAVGAYGTVEVPVDTTAIPTAPPHDIQPGETWNFQLWYRDQNPGPTSNLTDGVSITFQ